MPANVTLVLIEVKKIMNFEQLNAVYILGLIFGEEEVNDYIGVKMEQTSSIMKNAGNIASGAMALLALILLTAPIVYFSEKFKEKLREKFY